jgi:integrase
MRSGITDLDDGVFLVWVDLGRADGRRPRHQLRVRGLRKAQRELERLRREAAAGTLILTDRSVLSDLLDLWLAAAEVTTAAKTHERYSDIVERHLKPTIGATRLDRLQRSPQIICSFLADQLDHGGKNGRALSPQTVVHIGRALRTALQWATDDGMIASNPAAAASVRKVVRFYAGRARREVTHARPSMEQMHELVEATRGTLLHLPVVLAMSTGMRRGEILALRWRDIDLERATMVVRHALTQTRAGVGEKSPKSEAGLRTLALPAFAVRELQTAYDNLGPLAVPEGYVCCRPDGSAQRPDSFSANFAAFVQRHDLPQVTFHGLRHGQATWLASRGQQAKEISKRLGHGGIAITMDLYADLFEDVDPAAAASLDADYASKFGQQVVNEGSRTVRKGHLRLVK